MAKRNKRFGHANSFGALFISGEPECFPLHRGRKKILGRNNSTISRITRKFRQIQPKHWNAFSNMKKSTSSSRGNYGFTLIELLVVIAIIGILAAMVLPVIKAVKEKEQISRARMQIAQIVTAIQEFEGTTGRFPVSRDAINSVATSGDDFTFGGMYKTPLPPPWNVQASGSYKANNSEVMAVLLDLERFGNANATINQGHVINTEKRSFLPVKMSGDTESPGVGLDGVYRDPWGNPYIITLDLNHDEKTRDAFYKDPLVSTVTPPVGINGLIPTTVAGVSVFEANAPVMVWSAGPDKMIDPNLGGSLNGKANKGVNKDNVLSWK
jgi:prepilin-type N-terminal cleavage/methylation domain-containing protein